MPLWASRTMQAGFFFIWLHRHREPSLPPVTHSVPVTYLQHVIGLH